MTRKSRGAVRRPAETPAPSAASASAASPAKRRHLWLAVGVAVLLAIAGIGVVVTRPVALPSPAAASVPAPASYVGANSCQTCHQSEFAAWTGSHHQLAMQEATDSSVLGDFANVEFTHRGVESRFFKSPDGQFMVRTDGPDGKLADYPISYTFGVYPLQQYLIAFPGGRYQVLPIAWDSRPGSEGGQRWFHLYPDQKLDHKDPLHWTGIYQNWALQCAECHSTNLRKAYDAPSNRYQTTDRKSVV